MNQVLLRIVPEDTSLKIDLLSRLDSLKLLVESGELKSLAFVYATQDDYYAHSSSPEQAAMASILLARMI
jgi:hypothetical protein